MQMVSAAFYHEIVTYKEDNLSNKRTEAINIWRDRAKSKN